MKQLRGSYAQTFFNFRTTLAIPQYARLLQNLTQTLSNTEILIVFIVNWSKSKSSLSVGGLVRS